MFSIEGNRKRTRVTGIALTISICSLLLIPGCLGENRTLPNGYEVVVFNSLDICICRRSTICVRPCVDSWAISGDKVTGELRCGFTFELDTKSGNVKYWNQKGEPELFEGAEDEVELPNGYSLVLYKPSMQRSLSGGGYQHDLGSRVHIVDWKISENGIVTGTLSTNEPFEINANTHSIKINGKETNREFFDVD